MPIDMLNFEDKVVLITGAATGIGRATALAFAERGAILVIGDMNEAKARETVELVEAKGGKALFVKTDVRIEKEVVALVESTIDVFDRLDCAFNNAGISSPSVLLHEMDEDVFNQVLAVNLKGTFLCLKHELKHMVEVGNGVIVNTSSVAGMIPEPGMANYVAAKHGVIGLTKTAALEYAARGVRINTVAPGWVDTPMTRGIEEIPGLRQFLSDASPMHRAAQPEEIAGTVLFLCSDFASYITGQTFRVDGGQTIRGLFPQPP